MNATVKANSTRGTVDATDSAAQALLQKPSVRIGEMICLYFYVDYVHTRTAYVKRIYFLCITGVPGTEYSSSSSLSVHVTFAAGTPDAREADELACYL